MVTSAVLDLELVYVCIPEVVLSDKTQCLFLLQSHGKPYELPDIRWHNVSKHAAPSLARRP